MPCICSRPPFFLEEEEDDGGGGLHLVSHQSLCLPITLRQCRILFFAQCDKLTEPGVRRREADKKMDRFEHADATLHGGAVDTSRAMAVALPPILIALAPNLKAALHPFPLVMGV